MKKYNDIIDTMYSNASIRSKKEFCNYIYQLLSEEKQMRRR